MRTVLKVLVLSAALTLAPIAVVGAGAARSATVTLSCGTGVGLQICRDGADAWAERTGNDVAYVETPNSASERLALYQQMLAAGSGDIDVFMIDVIWPAILDEHFIDLAQHIDRETIDRHFPTIVENNTVDGRLIGMPWFVDVGLLYYRTDLLEKHGRQPPQTWRELTETARAIRAAEAEAGNDQPYGFVFQAKAYEGLTCDALEWIASHGGGTIVSDRGEVTVNNPRAVEALDLAASWIGDIAPEGVLNYAEEEARGVFQSGNAVFMRNWPYAWALAGSEDSPIRGKVGVAPLPRGGDDGRHAACLGGWQLAVSTYSPEIEAAVDLVEHLTSPEEQKRRAIVGALNPTIPAVYDDPEVLAANPFFAELDAIFASAVARPSTVTGERYNQVSTEFYNAVHQVLSGRADAASSLAGLERRLERMSRGGRWGG